MIKLNKKGFSLIELLVAMAVAAILLAGIYKAFNSQMKTHVAQQAVADMQQGLRASMFLMDKDIRMAGYNPTGLAPAQITTADNNLIEFTMDITGGQNDGDDNDDDGNFDAGDLNQDNDNLDNDGDGLVDEDDEADESRFGDGDVGDLFERIRYSLAGNTLQREFWDDVAVDWQSSDIAENIEALNFVYLDQDRNPLDDDGNGNVTASISQIRSIQITIVARADQNPNSMLPNQKIDTNTYTDQWGNVVLPPPNDRFRRIVLTAEVQCRNLGLP